MVPAYSMAGAVEANARIELAPRSCCARRGPRWRRRCDLVEEVEALGLHEPGDPRAPVRQQVHGGARERVDVTFAGRPACAARS